MNANSKRSAPSRRRSLTTRVTACCLTLLGVALACARSDVPIDYGHITPVAGPAGTQALAEGQSAQEGPFSTLVPASPPVAGLPTATPRPTLDVSSSPTPDATRPSLLQRTTVEEYVVQRGDSLGQIGERYGVTAAQIAAANGVLVTDTLFVGQVLLIPLPEGQPYGPEVKLLPDSEFVYGPGTVGFNLEAYVRSRGGFLAEYREDIPGYFLDGSADAATMSGAEIVHMVALRYSLNPRLLLAVLEHQSGWVTQPQASDNTLAYPLRRVEAGREGLYRQLSWAANQLNFGYYAWRAGAILSFGFSDGSIRLIAPGLNAGTVGVQHFLAKVLRPEDWPRAASRDGFARTYAAMFGNPFANAFEPLVPPALVQPPLQLPFEPGHVWAFTGGPHGAWDSGSAWAALDFAPPAKAEGCTPSEAWVVAAAPGPVLRSLHGAVVQDLDGDGYEGTGWVLFYMHVEARDRVGVGTWLAAGDRIGHPSCEGGISNGTHVHLARKYNGEWIPADGPLPMILDGWVSTGLGKEYDGHLLKGEVSIEACDCRSAANEISRP